jgi:hypothetical protein
MCRDTHVLGKALGQLNQWCLARTRVRLIVWNGIERSEWQGEMVWVGDETRFQDSLGVLQLEFSPSLFEDVSIERFEASITVKCERSPDGDNIEISNLESHTAFTSSEPRAVN